MLSSTVTSLKFVHCNPSMLTLLFSQKLFRILLLKKIICYRILNGSHTNVVTSGGHVDLPRMQRVAPSFSVSRIILVFLLTILMLVGTIARNIWEKMRGSAERVRFALFSAIHVSKNSVMGWRSRKWYYELEWFLVASAYGDCVCDFQMSQSSFGIIEGDVRFLSFGEQFTISSAASKLLPQCQMYLGMMKIKSSAWLIFSYSPSLLCSIHAQIIEYGE